MSDSSEPLTTTQTPPAIHGVVADLNTLFEQRHDLHTITVGGDTFVEKTDSSGARALENLSARARQSLQETLQIAAPLRPKGRLALRSEADFIAAVQAGHDNAHVFERYDPEVNPDIIGAQRITPTPKPPIPVALKTFAANPDTLLATATLNATDPTGGVGHGDWTVALHQDPNPGSQVWFDRLDQTLPHLTLASIIYAGGAAVVPKASWPADLATLAQRLDLDMATDLSALLAVAAADHRSTTDVRAKADANRGSRQIVMSTANSADVAVPTGLVIAWEPLPGYAVPVLVRLVSLPSDKGPEWRLVPVTLDLAARQLRDLLKANLTKALGDAAAVRLVLA